MKLSLKALRRWIDFEKEAEALAEELAQLGFPVDAIEPYGAACSEVVVAKILSRKPHPQADRLSLLQVSAGAEPLQIVCGATNMKEGDFVALAPVGANLPGDFRIKKSKIRGEESFGMCCSEVELGLQEKSEGIWILDSEKVKDSIGKTLSEVLSIEDVIFEVDVTPNRGDALSTRGLARELAAKWKLKLKPQSSVRWKTPSPYSNPSIENFDEAYAFATCFFSKVQLKETPAHWRQFLMASGGRSLNNLVDISNIILFDYGHPIHFFDADKVDAHSIAVRRAKAGERLKLLDGQEIELHTEDLVIADKERVLSLAGIMGGSESAVSAATQNVLLEVASFNPRFIRASLQRHGLQSESGYRFERGVRPHRLDEIVERVIALMQELSGYEIAEGTKIQAPRFERPSCLWSRERAEKKLGRLKWDDQEIFDRLRSLEYEFEPAAHQSKVYFPWYRTDAAELEDVMEDVARLIGYENLERKPLRFVEPVPVGGDLVSEWQLSDKLAREMASLGFVECLHLSFCSPEQEKLFLDSAESSIRIKNPIHAERSVMRQAISPQLLERALYNVDYSESDVRLFEIGPVFSSRPQGESCYKDSPFSEAWHLAAVMIPRAEDKKRLWRKDPDSFFQFKGACERFFEFGVEIAAVSGWNSDLFHPNRSFQIQGVVGGEIHPQLLKSLGAKADRAFLFECRLLRERGQLPYARPPQFPAIDFDVTFELSTELKMDQVMAEFEKSKPQTLEWVRVFDVYESKDLQEKSRRAVTFALRYRHPEQTLEMGEARKRHEKLINQVLGGIGPERIVLR